MKHTKIVATLGPAMDKPGMIEKAIRAGVNVARLNFSHGDHAEHGGRVKAFREASKRIGQTTAILQDLSGPKIRFGEFAEGSVVLKEGQAFTVTSEKVEGTEKIVSVNYPKLPKEVKKGDVLMVDDGKLRLRVVSTKGTEIKTKVEVGGKIKSRRGVNVPGANLSIPTITAKDKKDLAFGISQGVDFVALSFVRTAKDIQDLRKLLKKHNAEEVKIIAKIETVQAVQNYDEILKETDGVMIARGDLAIEIPAEEVPVLQKEFIWKAVELGKPVITATQMLESMTASPVATRAEVSDVANAVYDDTDAVMLSGETAYGDFAIEAIETMARVATRTEQEVLSRKYAEFLPHSSVTDAVTAAVEGVVGDTQAKAIVIFTKTGYSARMISRLRPGVVVVALTENKKVEQQLALSRNVLPLHIEQIHSVSEGLDKAKDILQRVRGLKKKDTLVVTGSYPYEKTLEKTNFIAVTEL